MLRKTGSAMVGAGLLAGAVCAEETKPVYKPLNFGGFSEFGMLQSGQYGNNKNFNDEWVDHFAAYIAQTVMPAEDLAFDIGLGGVFEYQKREVVQAQWGGTQYKNFFVGPSVADIRWKGAAGDGQGFGLQVGMFDYKDNPDAGNLGEYLFRTGAYPNYISSGGLWFVNRAAVQLQGMRATYGSGNLSGSLFLITETSLPALYDISAAAVVGYKAGDGLLDLGAGLNFKHMIPVKPSRTSPRRASNAYFTRDGVTYTGSDAYYFERRNFYRRRQQEDPANAAAYETLAVADSIKGANVKAWYADPAASGIEVKYYTQQGIVPVVRAALDFKKIIVSDLFGPADLRLFGEAAILGVQNYPFYYEKIGERIPIMAGFNFPGFNFIDLISLQLEYFDSPYLNSYWEQVRTNSAIPTAPLGSDVSRSGTGYGDIAKHDNLAWSVLIKKTFSGSAYVSAQFARDHIRTVSIDTWTAPEPNEVLGRSSDWYWMLQFGYGI